MKQCSSCKKSQSIDCFPKNKSKKSGYQSYCKACKKSMQAAWYAKNAVAQYQRTRANKKDTILWFNEFRATQFCQNCGENHPATLDFHHNKDKDFDISYMVHSGYGKERIANELAKCITLCSNCHRILHYNEKKHSSLDEIKRLI